MAVDGYFDFDGMTKVVSKGFDDIERSISLGGIESSVGAIPTVSQ